MSDLSTVKVYVKREFLLSNVRPVPLLMHISDQDHQTNLLYWNALREVLSKKVEVCYFDDLSEAGRIIIIPHNLKEYLRLNTVNKVLEFSRMCIKNNKFVVAHNLGSVQINPSYFSIQFRTNNTEENDKSVTIPNWLYDLGHHPNLPSLKNPLVGFTGNVEYQSRLNSVAKHIQLPEGWVNYLAYSRNLDEQLNMAGKQVIARYVRQKLLSQLLSFNRIKVNILGRTIAFFSAPLKIRRKMQLEYQSNIVNNIYSIVIRGDGQGFFQLYEIMSVGRIPIIIDTNVALPPLSKLRWTDFALIVPFHQLKMLEDRIIKFHQTHSEQALRTKCQMARQAYEELLPHNFVPDTILPMIIKKSGAHEQN